MSTLEGLGLDPAAVIIPGSLDKPNSALRLDGVVGAWPLDEPEREVSPLVIADDNQAAFWSPTGSVPPTIPFHIPLIEWAPRLSNNSAYPSIFFNL